GMIILLLLSTYTNPGASPLGEASHSPNLFAVDNTRKGDLERKSTQWWSNDEISWGSVTPRREETHLDLYTYSIIIKLSFQKDQEIVV
ncbi:phosphohydrolase, partial [Bacillus sp. SS-TM]